MSITYRKGNLFTHIMKDVHPKIIPHIVNNVGAWGAGFTKSMDDYFIEPRNGFRETHKDDGAYLGLVQYYKVYNVPYLIVANMYAQNGTIGRTNPHPIEYHHLENCLYRLSGKISIIRQFYQDIHVDHTFQVHMPKIGSRLAGGDWERIEPIIKQTLLNNDVFIYEL